MLIRASKFKNVFGKSAAREFCYENIRVSKSAGDILFCAVNVKFLAVILESAGGGSFLVHPLEKFGRVESSDQCCVISGHRAAITDLKWCPHNDQLIASGAEDGSVLLWQIPEQSHTHAHAHTHTHEQEAGHEPPRRVTAPISQLNGHKRRIVLINWHPTAEHVIATAGSDNLLYMWNAGTEQILVEMTFPNQIISLSFNLIGSRLATVSKDRISRVIDARKGEVITEGLCHDGSKPQQILYLKKGVILTAGFTKTNERKCCLWSEDNLGICLFTYDLESSNAIVYPHFDPDLNLVFLFGKGDCRLYYFELLFKGDQSVDADSNEASPRREAPILNYLNSFVGSQAQRGVGWMSKRGLSCSHFEIARAYRIIQLQSGFGGICEPVSFFVPRKPGSAHSDLYPNTASDQPAISAVDWMKGSDASPIMIEMHENSCDTFPAAIVQNVDHRTLPAQKSNTTQNQKSKLLSRFELDNAKESNKAKQQSEKIGDAISDTETENTSKVPVLITTPPTDSAEMAQLPRVQSPSTNNASSPTAITPSISNSSVVLRRNNGENPDKPLNRRGQCSPRPIRRRQTMFLQKNEIDDASDRMSQQIQQSSNLSVPNSSLKHSPSSSTCSTMTEDCRSPTVEDGAQGKSGIGKLTHIDLMQHIIQVRQSHHAESDDDKNTKRLLLDHDKKFGASKLVTHCSEIPERDSEPHRAGNFGKFSKKTHKSFETDDGRRLNEESTKANSITKTLKIPENPLIKSVESVKIPSNEAVRNERATSVGQIIVNEKPEEFTNQSAVLKMKSLFEDLQKAKSIIRNHDRRIRFLETELQNAKNKSNERCTKCNNERESKNPQKSTK